MDHVAELEAILQEDASIDGLIKSSRILHNAWHTLPKEELTAFNGHVILVSLYYKYADMIDQIEAYKNTDFMERVKARAKELFPAPPCPMPGCNQ